MENCETIEEFFNKSLDYVDNKYIYSPELLEYDGFGIRCNGKYIFSSAGEIYYYDDVKINKILNKLVCILEDRRINYTTRY
jgi:hypothetical protein